MSITPLELFIVLVWLLLPAWTLGSLAFAWLQRGHWRARRGRHVAAWLLMVVLSALVAFGMVTVPGGAMGHALGRTLGLHDEPFMWAPFPFIAVALVFPLVMWWVRKGAKSVTATSLRDI